MADDCIFCKIVKGEIPSIKVYENEHVLAFLDIYPLSIGHTLLIPKQHYPDLHSCSESVLVELTRNLPNIAKAVTKALNVQGYNILNNNGRCAGQLIDHVHFHIVPRVQDDHVIKHTPTIKYETESTDEIAERIRSAIQR